MIALIFYFKIWSPSFSTSKYDRLHFLLQTMIAFIFYFKIWSPSFSTSKYGRLHFLLQNSKRNFGILATDVSCCVWAFCFMLIAMWHRAVWWKHTVHCCLPEHFMFPSSVGYLTKFPVSRRIIRWIIVTCGKVVVDYFKLLYQCSRDWGKTRNIWESRTGLANHFEDACPNSI